jgi:type IV secretion system protein VirB10
MSDNFNDQFESEHMPENMFEFSGINEKPVNEMNMTEKNGNRHKKISFAELRQGRKIPRLKKSMVLAIITGGTFIFLIVVNLIMKKNREQDKYFNDELNSIAVGSEFSLGDLDKRPRLTENDNADIMETNEYYFASPPSYTPLPANTTVSRPSGGTVAHSAPAYYSDSDLLAIKAQIGKEGGYGLTAGSASYNPAGYTAGYFDAQTAMPGQFTTREEYIRQKIDEIATLTQMSGGDSRANADRINNGRYSDAGKYNPANLQQGTLQYLNDECLFPGTIIHAVLVSRIDTDYPGPIHARVSENVYDSMTGKHLLIPQGTILQGNYSSSSIGVSKVQIAWESMVVNYGGIAYQVSLGGMAGVDKRGRAGIAGTLDDHYFEWLKAAGIISLFSMLNSEISYQTQGQSNPQLRELMDMNQGIVNRIGDRLIERALNIQPTVRVKNGIAVSVSVNTVINLRPFPAIRAEEKWIKK